ncbi:copper chaperone PCu(A)C [Microbulbifer thermotolerans]|uniref:Uncharacterized protein n=1 Tax=Microbulbifer thermotolerans TaxID=252514 RepID=A0A143HJ68_MICTH|nr:copper chaperone PCu(A)C [Microbulbifer thermotolerans]AMX01546.1 hypothetical protein A3224_02175 [Microbulbifer thermotolerans]MCX2784183.1 copper chaperone PCu(A)C [Microbulbifer thermotolerans]MCX2832586.1 copper chaperone PCu(A)C [Microbulbifer thermotolerans]MCX2842769.1 copper chaperone PCu(A)C [Microbulbifer thermotolerans]WKT61029.1 copper chaperone PCu(A)C [Microbulbifer thermotolerans]
MRGVHIFLYTVFFLGIGASVWAQTVRVQGYARETLPGAAMTAAYLSFHNEGTGDMQLQSVELPDIDGAMVELHTTVDDDGVSRMRPLASLVIPAGGEVRMAPGGTHLMLHGVKLRAGEQLQLRLHFASGAVLEVEVPVRALPVAAQHHHHH